jgi:MFS family permease
MEPTWRGRVGSALLGAVVGAVIGWALSLTQEAHPQRWPWVLLGAVVVAAVFLLIWEVALGRRLPQRETPQRPRRVGIRNSGKARVRRSTFGKELDTGIDNQPGGELDEEGNVYE